MSYDDPVLSVDDLADQVAEVLDYFGLGAVMCMGVTAGAYILTLFAIKYTRRVLGLILISPLCKTPSWTEWLYNKVMSNVLYYYGMCGVVKELLLMRYFSKLLDERQSPNVLQFLEAINRRPDITVGLRKLHCRSLIFVGENSPFHFEALHMTSKLDRRFSALVEETYANKLREGNGLEPADPVNGVDDPGLKLYEEVVGGVKNGRLPGRPNEKWSKNSGHVSSSDFVTQVALQQSSQEVKKLKEQLAECERKRLRSERKRRRYEANQNANYQMLYEYMVCQAAKHGDPPPPHPLNFKANSSSEGASNTRNDSSPTNHGEDEIGDYYETPDDEMGTDNNETSDDEMGEDEMGEH